MSADRSALPAPARRLASAVDDAVAAALGGDAAGLDRAAGVLASDSERSGVVLAAVVRTLLEVQNADGLEGDDVAAALRGCVESAAPWYPGLDPAALVLVLTGALGAVPVPDDEDDAPAPAALGVAAHGALLVAHLLASTGASELTPVEDLLPRLAPLVDASLAEVERHESVEMP